MDSSERSPGGCDLLILLSGPEPQRSIFEKIILDQLGSAATHASDSGTQATDPGARAPRHGKTVLVRGLPGAPRGDKASPTPAGLVAHDHLSAKALNALVCGAGLVICRPGYSSVMDLLKLQKKCIFVPTPGQTEQEYLGNYLAGRHMAVCMSQDAFSIDHAIVAAENFSFWSPELGEDGLFRKMIGEWVSSLANGSTSL